MTGPDDKPMNDAQVWQQFAPSLQAGACPDALALAAYLDGRATAGEAEAVELHLAVCPKCVAEVAELRTILAGGPVLVPHHVMRYAKELAPRSPRSPVGRATVPANAPTAGRIPPRYGRIALRIAAVGVLAASAGLMGFGMGTNAADEHFDRQARARRSASADASAAAHDAQELAGMGNGDSDEVAFFLKGDKP